MTQQQPRVQPGQRYHFGDGSQGRGGLGAPREQPRLQPGQGSQGGEGLGATKQQPRLQPGQRYHFGEGSQGQEGFWGPKKGGTQGLPLGFQNMLPGVAQGGRNENAGGPGPLPDVIQYGNRPGNGYPGQQQGQQHGQAAPQGYNNNQQSNQGVFIGNQQRGKYVPNSMISQGGGRKPSEEYNPGINRQVGNPRGALVQGGNPSERKLGADFNQQGGAPNQQPMGNPQVTPTSKTVNKGQLPAQDGQGGTQVLPGMEKPAEGGGKEEGKSKPPVGGDKVKDKETQVEKDKKLAEENNKSLTKQGDGEGRTTKQPEPKKEVDSKDLVDKGDTSDKKEEGKDKGTSLMKLLRDEESEVGESSPLEPDHPGTKEEKVSVQVNKKGHVLEDGADKPDPNKGRDKETAKNQKEAPPLAVVGGGGERKGNKGGGAPAVLLHDINWSKKPEDARNHRG